MATRNVALIALYNEQKEILLQIRPGSASHPQNHFGFFGGGIEPGEKPEEALRRELVEELNYKVQDPKLILVQDFRGRGMGYDGDQYVFADKYDSSQTLLLREGLGMRWFRPQNIDQALVSNRDKETLAGISKFLDSVT